MSAIDWQARAIVRRVAMWILVVAVAAVTTPIASGAPSNSVHPAPYHGAHGVTRLCGPSSAYACTTGGYAGQSDGWSGAKYGPGYASRNSAGLHNCTLYAAWKVRQNGLGDPGWS